jgi:hypothetical protein
MQDEGYNETKRKFPGSLAKFYEVARRELVSQSRHRMESGDRTSAIHTTSIHPSIHSSIYPFRARVGIKKGKEKITGNARTASNVRLNFSVENDQTTVGPPNYLPIYLPSYQHLKAVK